MKLLYILTALLFLNNLQAQNYIPIPESDAIWIQAGFLYSMNGHEHSTVTNPLSFGSDSIIGGETYHKLQGHEIVEWIDGWGSQQNYATGEYTVHGYEFLFRQDVPAKKVYTWQGNSDTLLYDFDLTVGQVYPETWININYPNLLVMGEDSVQLLDGIYHKKWLLGTESADSGYISLIEGVGASSGFSLIMFPLFEQTGAIMCFKESNNQVYENWGATGLIPAKYSEFCDADVSVEEVLKKQSNIQIWPNPAISNLNILYDKGIKSVVVTDISGRVIIKSNGGNEYAMKLNITDLLMGQYFIQILTSDQKILTQTFVK